VGGHGGIRTEHDFVEAPSQMLEEWMKSPEVLASVREGSQDRQGRPAELVKRMNRANDFGKGLLVRRQMVYAGCRSRATTATRPAYRPTSCSATW
jgi:thimet oligopeptidase